MMYRYDHPIGDIIDVHDYVEPRSPGAKWNRAAVLGEYGGLGYKVTPILPRPDSHACWVSMQGQSACRGADQSVQQADPAVLRAQQCAGPCSRLHCGVARLDPASLQAPQ